MQPPSLEPFLSRRSSPTLPRSLHRCHNLPKMALLGNGCVRLQHPRFGPFLGQVLQGGAPKNENQMRTYQNLTYLGARYITFVGGAFMMEKCALYAKLHQQGKLQSDTFRENKLLNFTRVEQIMRGNLWRKGRCQGGTLTQRQPRT